MKFKLMVTVVISIIFSIWLFSKEEKKTILIIESNFNWENDYVNDEDERIVDIWDSGKYFILNKSNATLILDPIRYGPANKEVDRYEKIIIGDGITALNFSPHIAYKFEEPPIFTNAPLKGITKWYLHKE